MSPFHFPFLTVFRIYPRLATHILPSADPSTGLGGPATSSGWGRGKTVGVPQRVPGVRKVSDKGSSVLQSLTTILPPVSLSAPVPTLKTLPVPLRESVCDMTPRGLFGPPTAVVGVRYLPVLSSGVGPTRPPTRSGCGHTGDKEVHRK